MPPSSMQWDLSLMPDISGKIAIVTGANANLGYETALGLALGGAHVILACRSEERGRAAEAKLTSTLAETPEGKPRGSVEFMLLDVGDLKSIAAFVDAFLAKFDRLDLLVNNAGMKAINHSTTVDGFETQFGVNHLGHFALTGRLFERLKQNADRARIVNVSSISHHYVALDFDNLNAAPPVYEAMDSYRKSKLATMLFSYELDRRLKRAGIENVISVPCHPGVTESNLLPNLEKTYNWAIMRGIVRLIHKIPFAQSNAMGALCILNAAVDPNVVGGEFIGPHGLAEFYGYPRVVPASKQSHDEAAAVRLWSESEKLTGVTFNVEK
ncbi:hypothetical protein Poli38472_003752 [Pythium oligandrum]|uniref:Uncharacterized protein n=1 Tax=Pythium oligandrum TaxID=41045 RepID=A0A8K1FNL2_PYTOL|nr:hypothetical protein Poli38472_003752 [Pythium oligandrum]|eukprot:TMW65987.1 hypothetical protein Poli38472_003752 [Pythium oligandrum]